MQSNQDRFKVNTGGNKSTANPTSVQREVYRKLREAQEATIFPIRPGVLAEDLFYICKDELGKRRLPFRMPHVGNSLGIELHENPMVRPGSRTPLVPGTVLNIEPTVFYEERSYHNEDLVVVTETGVRLLSLGVAPKEIPEISSRVSYL